MMTVGFGIDTVVIGPDRNGSRRGDFSVMAGTIIDDSFVVPLIPLLRCNDRNVFSGYFRRI